MVVKAAPLVLSSALPAKKRLPVPSAPALARFNWPARCVRTPVKVFAPERVKEPAPVFSRLAAPATIPERVKLPAVTSKTESPERVTPRLAPRSIVPVVPRVAPPSVRASATKAAETSPRLLAAVMFTRP